MVENHKLSQSAADQYKQTPLNITNGYVPNDSYKYPYFFDAVIAEAESRGAEADELRELLGRAASKRGIFEGDLENGELEIGQIASTIKEVKPVAQIMHELITDFHTTQSKIQTL